MNTPKFQKTNVKENIKPRGLLTQEINSLNSELIEASSIKDDQISQFLNLREQAKKVAREELKQQLESRFYRLMNAEIVVEDDKMEMK